MARRAKPELALWLIDERKRNNRSVRDVAQLVNRSEATVRGWEAGRPPRADDEVIALLESVYDSVAPRSEEERAGDLAHAILELRDELAAMRLEREAWQRGLVSVLREYAAGQVPEALLDALAPRPLEDARS